VFPELQSRIAPFVNAWPKWLIRLLWAVAIFYLVWLAVVTGLRVAFPWDVATWSESPFMTNMLKLDQQQPVFGPPADANSFVYSPGLEYICFALLKPFELHLDIRFCRLVNVGIAVLTALAVGTFFRCVSNLLVPEKRPGVLPWLGAGIALLVVFRNFTSDTAHPDNLVMCHTAGLFLVTLAALQNRSFGLALLGMIYAALGVFTKQILLLSFVGPALVFWRFGEWGWRRSLVLAGAGALATAASLWLLWAPPFARFYTLEVLSRQGFHWPQLVWMLMDLFYADRAVLLALAVAAVSVLWGSNEPARRLLALWACLGIFSICPNAVSYLKTMGTWNNLIIFQLWFLLILWPAAVVWVNEHPSPAATRGSDRFGVVFGVLLAVFVALLFPRHLPPSRSMHACCAGIQQAISRDIHDGKKVLVAHGTMYQLRAGSKAVPRDRANSALELNVARMGNLMQTADRLRRREYDRVYLVLPEWYGPEVLAAIQANYVTNSIIARPQTTDRLELGRALSLMADCAILSPRPASN
jgi:hypothetical protein